MYENKTISEVERIFKTSIKSGLKDEKAKEILKKTGKNVLKEKRKKGVFVIFLSQFHSPLIYILIVCGIISFLLREVADSCIIFVVIFVNAIIGLVQEMKAEKALLALKAMSSPKAIVKRDGSYKEIKSEDVVEGDILKINAGTILSADIRIISASSLQIDESSLTGESQPIEKHVEVIKEEFVPLGDKRNMGFMSTSVAYGHGEGIVVATAMKTEIGKIAKLLNDTKEEMTPLQKRLASLGKLLGIVSVGVCLLLFVVSLFQKRDHVEMFLTSVSLAVAAIPEGLTTVVTIVLALGVERMAKSNAIVRKLPSVETLGSVTVVLSDKTGTLTENKMTVKKIGYNGKIYDVETNLNKDFNPLIEGLVLCNNADENIGNPTECALLNLGNLYKIKRNILEKEYPRLFEIPFDSTRKMMTTTHKYKEGQRHYTKGATDYILSKCEYVLREGKIVLLDEEKKKEIIEQAQTLSSEAMRVLALAYSLTTPEKEMIFVGVVGIIDPPRKEAKEAIATLFKAGIKTVMITGDHKETAFAIGKQMNIASYRDQCIDGVELDKMSDDKLKEIIDDVTIFARVSPLHKTRIVNAFKSKGHITAMTGDGVNDAPSLKAADIGIAMGITGTDVAKFASDMILSDDNFSSIQKAVAQGREIYDNIKKTIIFLLSSNFAEVLTMLVMVVFGFPVPLLAIHILWVNLITDSLPAVALGADKRRDDIMLEKPRQPKENLLARGGLKLTLVYGVSITILTVIAFLIVPMTVLKDRDATFSFFNFASNYKSILDLFADQPKVLLRARTYAFTTLGMSQLFHMLGMSSISERCIKIIKKGNVVMIFAFIIGLVLQILVTEIPFLTSAFQTQSLLLLEWVWLFLLSAFPLFLHELLVPYFKKKDIKK